MNLIPTEITGVTHPLIDSMYVKEVRGKHGRMGQVLVARTTIGSRDVITGEAEDQVWDLMNDLQGLKRKAIRQNGPIDYLEIRYAS